LIFGKKIGLSLDRKKGRRRKKRAEKDKIEKKNGFRQD